MENKENVFVQNEKTEQAVGTEKNADFGVDEMGSAVFKKFKDVNALARAYGALEAEFTRRSQRLKELERKMEEGQKAVLETLPEDVGDDGDCRGAEKLTAGEAHAESFSFAKDLENAVQPSDGAGDGEMVVGIGRSSIESNTAEDQVSGQGYGESAFSDGEKPSDTVVATSAESVELALSDDEIYRIVNSNESVRIKIVGEYLASLKKGAPLVRGGVGTVTTPPSRARSVAEAGDMALRFFQTGK